MLFYLSELVCCNMFLILETVPKTQNRHALKHLVHLYSPKLTIADFSSQFSNVVF